MTPRQVIALCVFALGLNLVSAVLATDPPDPSILRRPFKPWNGGHAYWTWAQVPFYRGDREGEAISTVQLYEDDKPLGPAHSSFNEILTEGAGRFIFLNDIPTTRMVFSSSDNSDPNTNGRTYRLVDSAITERALQLSFQTPSAWKR